MAEKNYEEASVLVTHELDKFAYLLRETVAVIDRYLGCAARSVRQLENFEKQLLCGGADEKEDFNLRTVMGLVREGLSRITLASAQVEVFEKVMNLGYEECLREMKTVILRVLADKGKKED